ncbi:MAG: nicotinate (nicotinamide) nucleotide adenylyltransferase [Gammaproteobacteria bacterium]|nr:nicotinate (nicotinamide) nucleotide adenylyltransferase [Gammaproteobacteria bacterium]MDE0441740.1 nicotinate (nicotinamide) nucleotide adenylyltransferase [Gammaproteobacteria bacterium]
MKAILGGTFDPVHLGHLHAARRARAALGVPDVTLLLAARPGHRAAPRAGTRDRWRMLRLATRRDAGLLASDLEVVRPGPSYTVDSLSGLRGGDPLVWLIGRDALADVPSWHRAGELASLCHLLVLDRPGVNGFGPPVPQGFERLDDIAHLAERPSGGLYCLPNAMLDISASQIRRMIAEGGDASALLPCDVWTYIWQRGLYRSSGVEGSPDEPKERCRRDQ